MENISERVIVVNREPDFIQNDETDFSANFIILCENDNYQRNEQLYKNTVCGLSIAEWVAMACDGKPIFLNISEKDNFLNLIRPYINEKEYMVVLYANTPLLTKTHLNDLICYIKRKRFNACKLKKGYILKSEYVMDVDSIYSNFLYDFESDDFFEVNTVSDLEVARIALEKRIFSHHTKKGVVFESQKTINIDANVKMGMDSRIYGGVSILKNSTIGDNVTLESNVVIINSKIGSGTIVKSGTIIENSVVKSNTEISNNSCIIHSVVGDNVKIGVSAKIVDSAIEAGVEVENFVNIDTANILNGAKIGKFSNIVGLGVSVVVVQNAEIKPFANLVQSK